MDKLITEMIAKIAIAHSKARRIKINENDYKNEVFIYPNNEDMINPKYISPFEYYQIVQFYEFLNKHEDLSDCDINNILSANNRFDFLLMLKNTIPNFIVELKKHGPKAVAIIYINDKVFSNKVEL